MFVKMVCVWLAASLLPHGVVRLLAGKPYFALPPVQGLMVELVIMALNLTLPVLMLVAVDRVRPSALREALAWQWDGWRTAVWGAIGFPSVLSCYFPRSTGW